MADGFDNAHPPAGLTGLPATGTVVGVESRCAKCDLLTGQCEHTRAATARRAPVHDLILISPASVAHLPGCGHNDDLDIARYWGEISGDPGAWERVRNGSPVPANGGANRALVATRLCLDCVARS